MMKFVCSSDLIGLDDEQLGDIYSESAISLKANVDLV